MRRMGEKAWIAAYVDAREDWLATHENEALHPTVYRMEAFKRLIQLDHWGLDLPLVVRGQEVSTATLNGTPLGCYDGPQPGSRALALQTSLAHGLDVRLVQLGLSGRGSDIKADGVCGQTSAARIKDFQQAHGLPPTGIVDAALIAQLLTRRGPTAERATPLAWPDPSNWQTEAAPASQMAPTHMELPTWPAQPTTPTTRSSTCAALLDQCMLRIMPSNDWMPQPSSI
ncbi:peptidoglycan-binding protein [Pseudomonas cavernicola]|uniref:Peptidoglycan-binding protein n=2 Tax=Pseudomonas cavernicola TaxID=2320866 RepID=A0A418XM87_9PSED|nr:peptidoglycan-binding protein [Pseudomonas cavernicola]